MNMTLAKRLERLKNRQTRYEVVAVHPDQSESLLIGYTTRKSGDGMIALIRQNGVHFAKHTGAKQIEKVDAKTFTTENGWTISFSGRTQRDAIINGEHPFVGELS